MSLHDERTLEKLQRYIANVGISGASLRNQGAPGVILAARTFLATVDLTRLRDMAHPEQYSAWLDRTTRRLMKALPEPAEKWGVARKAINIFTTQAFLNGRLSSTFRLARLGHVMETPLDGVAAKGLRKQGGSHLPRWRGVRQLTPDVSRQYQEFASEVARNKDLPRACLDIVLWRPEERQ